MNEKDGKNNEVREFGHDVLNSLTRIIGQLEASLLSEDLPQIKSRLALTLHAAHECAAFCKENMNNAAPTKESFFIASFLKDVQESYRKSLPDFHLQIESAKASSVQIESNKLMLRNAIQNLTKNSIEAGAKKMVISIDMHRICFIDNGPGISQEKANKIREKGTTKEDSAGHGLGLLSISRFCKVNGWKLKFHNNENTEYFPSGFTVEFIFNQ
jgi:signal transduction histidine kinase